MAVKLLGLLPLLLAACRPCVASLQSFQRTPLLSSKLVLLAKENPEQCSEWQLIVAKVLGKVDTENATDAATPSSFHPADDRPPRKHQPHLSIVGDKATALVRGEGGSLEKLASMTKENYVQVIWVEDAQGHIVHLHKFSCSEPEPKINFTLPLPISTAYTAYEYNNKHGLWQGKAVSLIEPTSQPDKVNCSKAQPHPDMTGDVVLDCSSGETSASCAGKCKQDGSVAQMVQNNHEKFKKEEGDYDASAHVLAAKQ